MFGLMGKVLIVDLNAGKVKEESLTHWHYWHDRQFPTSVRTK